MSQIEWLHAYEYIHCYMQGDAQDIQDDLGPRQWGTRTQPLRQS
jgi:hypothetical protein